MQFQLISFLVCVSTTSIAHSADSTGKLEEKLRFTISEGVPPGTVAGRIERRDGYTYRLNERNRFFEFNSSSGEVRTISEIGSPVLDREALDRYGYKHDDVDFVILATATSTAVSPPTYFLAITVRVVDINDNAPAFPFPFQNVSLPESARVGTRLILASASDADEGENGAIKEYKLISGNEDGVFQLARGGNGKQDESSESILLELSKPVDRETKALYVLNVSAIDGGTPALIGFMTVFVNVLDSNDNPPIFDRQQYAVSVSENLPAGSSILLVSATDKDSGENARITYSIGNDVENQFKVNPETGVISSNTAPLKCPEVKSTNSSNGPRMCTFTVEAVDHGVPAQRGRAFVNVELFDVNDHAPEIAFRFYSAGGNGNDVGAAAIVDETKPIGTVIAVVTVTDPDHGENGQTNVHVVKGNELGHFRLESNDLFSVVRTNATLRRARVDKYNLTVMAIDRGTPPKYTLKTMLIYVNDASDRPPIFDQSIYSAKVKENAPLGTFVVAVRAAASSDECSVPVWYDFVNDSDSGVQPTLFHLDHNTGLITVRGPLDFDQESTSGRNFSFTVTARDACRPSLHSSSAVVRIDLIDQNDQAPTFVKDVYKVAVPENASVGSLILKMEARDGDSGENGRISYSFGDATNQSIISYFQLHESTGALTLATPLDRETIDSYKLIVLASDHGSPPLQSRATVHIMVLDVNDNAPKFLAVEYYANLYPFDPAGSTLTRIQADDADDGVDGEVTYFFLEPPPISGISLLPKTGEIYLKTRPIWNAATTRFDLVLGAADGGGLRASNNATVHVFVLDVGEANHSVLPRFTKDSYVFRVREDAATSRSNGASKSIGTVSATDADSPISASSPVHYKIASGDPTSLFEVGPYSGELRSTRLIDYEEASSHTLTIVALGKFGSTLAQVRIEVEDSNDNAPRFLANGTKLVVERERPAGFRFFTAKAVDLDSGVNGAIKYALWDGGDDFGVDPTTGTLFLKAPAYNLKKLVHSVTVVASDRGTPSLSDQATFHVHVLDGDPRYHGTFPKTNYDFAVWENTAVNRKLIQLNLTKTCNEKDTVDCVYGVDDDALDDAFGLFPDGWLYVRNVLDYERRASFELNVRVRQRLAIKNGRSNNEGTSEAVVNLQLLDQNDNAPRCVSELFRFNLPERSEPLARVGAVVAEDADGGLNGLVKYRLLPDSENYASSFRIGTYSGSLTTLRPFDRESLLKSRGSAAIELLAEAEDSGTPETKRTRCKVNVDISDANDHAPQFALDVYAVSLPENHEIGSEILRVSATDDDELENAMIEFSIVDGDDDGRRFWMNSSTGQLFLRRTLDREERSSYTLQLMARDFGKPERLNSTAYATIFVLDVNDNAPAFVDLERTINISELASIGTVLARVSSVDADSGPAGTVRYSITKGNAGQMFELDAITGELVLVKQLDFETQRNFTLTILALDQGSPSLMNASDVFIQVLDENDNAPLITTSILVAQVAGESPIGAKMLTITASDADSGVNGTVRFRVLNQKPLSAFGIDERSGVLFLAHPLDLESTDVYNVLIEATDLCELENLRLSTRRMITVLVTGGNGNRTADPFAVTRPAKKRLPRLSEYYYQFQASEDSAIGATVGVIRILDEQRNDSPVGRVKFSIANGSVPFRVDPETGVVATTDQLDRESVPFYDFEIRADDAGSTALAMVHVDVLDVNDNEPTFLDAANSTMRFKTVEGEQKNSFVGKVLAIDKDAGANGEIEYSWESPETASFFMLDPATGIIRTNRFIDREEFAVFFLTVQATDRGNPPKRSKATVFVEVLDVNDNPPILERLFYELAINENVSIGSVLLQLSPSDYDTDTNFSYSIVSGNVWRQFSIDENGTLMVSSPLDREIRSVYHLVVSVYDQPPSVALRHAINVQVTIDVMDVNDCSPRFISANWTSINVNAPIGSVVTTVKAMDLDEGPAGFVNYLLDPQSAGYFSIDPLSGDVRLANALARNATGSVHNLSIWAYDRGEPSLNSNWQLTVYVLDVKHQQTPTFEQRTFQVAVPEDIPVGKSLLQLSTAISGSADGFEDGLRFWLLDSQSDGPDFDVAPVTGIVSISNPLDYERKSNYNLTVAVASSESETSSPFDVASILVQVKDVNDNSPVFFQSPIYFDVVEGSWTQATSVGLVAARDADSGANGKLSYSIIQGNTTVFSIDSLSGELKMQGDVDREAISSYKLTVEAADSGTPRRTTSTSVVITVLDVNDNDPIFGNPSYVGSILENQPAGVSLLQVLATDADEGENGVISYRFESREKLPFVIDEATGEIRTKAPLDREMKSKYDFLVVAVDSSVGEPRSSSVRVRVNVDDENDNTPTFVDTAQDIYISSSVESGNFVYVVGAEDADEGENARLRYSLSGRDAKYFSILPDTGVVQWKAAPALASSDFSVDVFVSDSGTTMTRNASTSLRFFPRSASDFPRFAQPSGNFSVLENQTNAVVTTVTARSSKQAPLHRITYSIASGNFGGAFALNALTGRLTTTPKLDYEYKHAYELYVAATDNDNPPLTSFLKIAVQLEDCNDNAPVFEKTLYAATVLEEEPPPLKVVQVQAVDADSGLNGKVRYSLSEDLPSGANELFEIDPETGVVSTKAALDREKMSQYKLIVEAMDSGTPVLSSSVAVVVDVADINDNAPKFTRLFAADVREDAVVGTFVIQVTSSDADSAPENTNNTYHFSVNPGEKFSIDSRTGNVTVNGQLDRETQAEYPLKVVAVDGAWRVETSLTITVLDVNDNAPKFNVTELQPPLTSVGKVGATDLDEKGPNSKITYRLSEKSSLFVVDSQSGELRTSTILRRGTLDSNVHHLVIYAEDGGRPMLSSTTRVALNLTNKRSRDIFGRRSFVLAIPMEVENGAKMINLATLGGEEENGNVIYRLESQDDDFAVDSAWIVSTKRLSNAVGTQFKLSVVAQDSESSAVLDSADLTLVVAELNKNTPEFSSSTYSVTLPENTKPGSAIFTVSARDYDQGLNGKVSYACVRNKTRNDNCGVFLVDEETGVIVLKKELDYEVAKQHAIVVSALDGGFERKTSFATLYVNVQDVNDNAPQFVGSQLVFHVQENTVHGSTVHHLKCTDADSPPYDTILYSIEDGADDRFSVDGKTGDVTVVGDIDYESKALYKVVVKCKNPDSSTMFSTANLTIYVDGTNEYLPRFDQSKYDFEIDSMASVGAVVGRIKAIDEDLGPDGVVYYSLEARSDGQLAVNELTGEIFIKKAVARNFATAVYAYNRQLSTPGTIATAHVTIMVSSGVVSSLSFGPKNIYAEVLENAPIGTLVASLNVTSRGRIFYELVSGNLGNAFQLDPAIGALRVDGKLDRETVDSYTVLVNVFGERRSTANATVTVTIKVLDVNDNAPYLTKSASVGYILENEPSGTTIMTLLPSDDDLPPNKGPFNFTLLDSKHLFNLDSTTGVLTSKAPFDREAISRYYLRVKITDAGQPSLWSVSNVTVVVEDVNDSPSTPPAVQTKIISFDSTILEKMEIARVFPDDADLVGDYSCKLRSSNDSGVRFLIKSNCVIANDDPIPVPSSHRFSLTGADGLHDLVDYEADVTFEKGSEDWATNSVSMLVRGDRGKLAKTFRSVIDSMLLGKDKVFARIVHADSAKTIFDDDMEIAMVILKDDGTLLPHFNAVELLRSSLKDKAVLGAGIEISNIFTGFCADEVNRTSPCQNGGKCVELANIDKRRYNFLTEGSLSLAFPQITKSYRCDCPSDFAGSHCEISIDRCAFHSCANGATCVYRKDRSKIECVCPSGFAGSECQDDIDECKTVGACLNDGWCENTKGSYRCVCMVGYGGPRCENSTNYCASEPCLNGGTCVAKSDGYQCTCEFGFSGRQCQFGSVGFSEASYLELRSDVFSKNNGERLLQFEFATIHANALLLFSSKVGSGDFTGLDVVNGKLRLAGTVKGKSGSMDVVVNTKKAVNDGRWRRVSLVQSGTMTVVSVTECSSLDCAECPIKDDSCRAVADLGASNVSLFPGEFLYFGSSRNFSRLLSKARHLSAPGFVGCMRNLEINGVGSSKLEITNQDVLNYCPRLNQPPCSSNKLNLTCSDGEKCQDGWSKPICSCRGGFSSSNCKTAEQSMSFAGNGFISYAMTESYRRRMLYSIVVPESRNMDEVYRFKRTPTHYPKQWVIMEFRTTSNDGLLFFSKTSNEDFTIIDIVNGTVRYMSRSKASKPMQISLNDGPLVSDGDWHLVSLALQSSGNEVEFRIDNFGKDAKMEMALHAFMSADLTAMSIGGAAEPLTVTGNSLKGFDGCLRKLIINGVVQPLNQGDVTFLEPKLVGDVEDGCARFSNCLSPPCANSPVNDGKDGAHFNAGLVAVLVFFSCMILSMIVAYFIVRKLKLKNFGKKNCCDLVGGGERTAIVGATSSMVANISTLSDIVRLRQRSECTNLNGSIKDSGIVLGVSRQTLDGSQISLNNPLDVHGTASTLSVSTYLNNYLDAGEHATTRSHLRTARDASIRNGKQASNSNPFLERYDLDDASSIAPSDADVTKHYRDYRHSGFGAFPAEGQQRKMPSKFVLPSAPAQLDSVIPSLFGPNYASAQSLGIGRNRKSPGLRATPTSVLAMMPESESSDEVMMQRTVCVGQDGGGSTEFFSKTRPDSSRSLRSKQRRNPTDGKMRRSSRNSNKSRSRRRASDGRKAADSTTSSDDTPTVRSPIGTGKTPGSNAAPTILSRQANGLAYRQSSTNDEYSDNVSTGINLEFDLDQVRKPRRFLQPPDETETESDRNAANGFGKAFCVDQFIPGPRTLFLMSEDENASETETEFRRCDGATGEAKPSDQPNSGKQKDDLEAYV